MTASLRSTDRADRRQRPPDQHPGALDDRRRSTLRRTTGLGLDRPTTAVRLEAAVATADARPTIGLDDDVADVPGVADPAVQELARR